MVQASRVDALAPSVVGIRHAHRIGLDQRYLVAAYHMLSRGVSYRELGEAYLDHLDRTRTAANLKRRLERLDYVVTIQPKNEGPLPQEAVS